ncbi:unnamed protein product [Polarella glacialis]|uniref:Spindle pole body component n=1 Tax=Polarella glacialis TaxID=89957 RepID=A0A813L569_POLGL|nr:unnamed protein product [Polarella glacialis]
MLAEWTRTRRRTVWVVALLLAHIEDGTSQPEPAGVFPELPRLFGGESCPPRPSLRPADCRRVDTTINRVLYDQLEAVHAIAIDAFETSTTLWTDLAQILQFLNGLREFLCHARYGYCHFPNTEVLFNHMEVACQELNAACEAMPCCSEALAGGDLCKDSVNTEAQNGRLFGRVLDGLAVFVARLAMKSDLEEGTWADLPHLASVLAAGSLARRGVGFRDQGDICSEQLAPRRIQGLDGKIYDVGGGLKARLLTPWRAIGLLTELDDLGPSLLRHVVNLGAGEMDAANCVLERARGFSGILLEAWTRDFYHGLELDPHIMVDDLLSNDEQQLEIQRAQELLRERIDASQHAEG